MKTQRSFYKTDGDIAIAQGWKSGSTADINPTAGDSAAETAMENSDAAYKVSDQANKSGKKDDHEEAAKRLRAAADSHNRAAGLYDREENPRRAQEERALVNVRNKAAERHDNQRNSTTGQAKAGEEHPFMASARAAAADNGIGLEEAMVTVARGNYGLYQDWLKASAKAANGSMIRRTQAVEEHPFMAKVHAIAAAKGCSDTDAMIEAANQDYELYRSFVKGQAAR